ncbi:hypothetical protein ABTN82_19260, partial [Acinetobacter baumannii]
GLDPRGIKSEKLANSLQNERSPLQLPTDSEPILVNYKNAFNLLYPTLHYPNLHWIRELTHQIVWCRLLTLPERI